MKAMFTLENKIAGITGSGSGIGRAIALLFAQQGATVYLIDLNQAAVEETAARINDPSKAKASPVDVTDVEAVQNLFSRMGTLDILVNSAGVSHIGSIETTTGEDLTRLFDVNVKGVFHCM